MAAQSWSDFALPTFSLCSVFVNALLLLTLRHFRKKQPFDSPFFAIFVSLGINDIAVLVVKYVFIVSVRWGVVPAVLWDSPPFYPFSKMGYMAYFHLQFSQYIGCVLMAWNRFTAFAYPAKYKSMWSASGLKYYFALQWLSPMVASAHIASQPLKIVSFDNQTNAVQFSFENYIVMLLYFGLVALIGTVCALIIAVLYLLSIVKLCQHHKTPAAQQNDRKMAAETKLLLNGCVIFVSMLIYVAFFWLMILVRNAGFTFRFLYDFSSDLFCWNNVYVLLILNQRMRTHFRAFLTCSQPKPESESSAAGRQKNKLHTIPTK